jgi:HTH-type transcriptional regulator / antitoxin MqsA
VTGKPMVRDVRPMKLTYRGESITVDMPGWYCRDSDESVHIGNDMEVSDRALRILKARAEHLLSSSDIRRIRKALGLTQREAGEIIGGGPNAFQKYESGEILASRAVSNLLRVLERHPDEIAALRDARTKAPAVVTAAKRRTQPLRKSASISRRKGPARSSRSKA